MYNLTQRQNECACSSPVSNLTQQNGGIFKIPIVCFRFAWISPNKIDKVATLRKGSFELPPSHILFNKKNIVVTGVNLAIEVEHS